MPDWQPNSHMELKDIRRAALKSYIERQFDDVARQFALAVEKPESQINDMLAGRKSFGEKVARDMARKLGLPPDYFDHIRNITPTGTEMGAASPGNYGYSLDPVAVVESIMRDIDDDGRDEILGHARYVKYQYDQKNKS